MTEATQRSTRASVSSASVGFVEGALSRPREAG